ncbi:uncharacterized protein [Procambarus clarkii]|uniref:uncharacterized protein n=1 Tax=Procambarus clarkii TaxID=6728 RepID=UPI0037432679
MKMASEPKSDSLSTQNEITQNTSTNSDPFLDDWSSLDSSGHLKKEECQDRIVQVSVPEYEGHLLSAIRASRKNEDLTDGSIVVQNHTFNVHRLIISAFSNTLRKSFVDESSRVVVINDMDPYIMSCILDFIYGNLAIVKENQLLSFFKAAKQLDIEHLQTPGLMKLEQNLLIQNKSLDSSSGTERSSDASHSLKTTKFPKQDRSVLGLTSCPHSSPNTDNSHDSKHNDLSVLKARLPPSLSLVVLDEKKCKATIGDYTDKMTRNGEGKARVSSEPLDKRNEEEKTHCCCCKKSNESSQEKQKEVVEEDGENQSLMKKLKKFGTVISSSSVNTLLDIPAWLFSSSSISLTPIQSSNKVSTPKDSRHFNKTTTTEVPSQSPITDPDIIEIDSFPSKFSPTSVSKTSQNSFPNQQKQAASGPSPTNRSYYAGDNTGSKRGRVPSGLRGGHGRKYITSNAQAHEGTPSLRQENVGNRRFNFGSSRGRFNKMPHAVSRGGYYSVKQNPTAQVGTGRGRGCNRGRRNTLAGKAIYSRVSKITDDRPGVSKATVLWNGKEPIDIIDSGITVQLLDTAAEVIQNSFCLNSGVILNNHNNLDSENSQLESLQLSENTGNTIATHPPDSHSEVKGLLQSSENTSTVIRKSDQSSDLQPSENNQNAILAQSQEHSSTPSELSSSLADDQTTAKEISRDLDGKSSEVENDLPNLTEELTDKLDADAKEEKNQPSTSETAGDGETAGDDGDDLSVSNTDVKPTTSNGDSVQLDNADEQDQPVKPSTARKQKKRWGRPKFDQQCTVCKKHFSNHSSLVMHMRIHSEENPFHCSSCDYRTELYNSMKKHVAGKHKRALKESEGKRHHAPVVCPSQVFEKPGKITKVDDLQKQEMEINDESQKVEDKMQSEEIETNNKEDEPSVSQKDDTEVKENPLVESGNDKKRKSGTDEASVSNKSQTLTKVVKKRK